MPDLTPKQEAFALAFVELGSGAGAYRDAYDVSPDIKPETVWSEASRLLADPKVSARVIELQEAAAERTLVTVESITAELDEAKTLAQIEKQPAAMTSAIMGKAKVNGLLIDKQDVTSNGETMAMPAVVALNGVKPEEDDNSDN